MSIEFTAPGTVVFATVSGSRAYGTHRPDSDTDYKGIYVHDVDDLLGISPPQGERLTVVSHDPDVQLHDIGKFVYLATQSNPTILEALYADPQHHLVTSPWSEELIANRHRFPSRQRVADAYLGYARHQLRKLDAGGFGNGMDGRAAKHTFHIVRLLEQGHRLISTGELTVTVADPDRLRATAAVLVKDRLHVTGYIEHYTDMFALTASPLPDQADWDWASDFVLRVRRAHWKGSAA